MNFKQYTSVTDIVLNDQIKYADLNFANAFSGMTSLVNLTIPYRARTDTSGANKYSISNMESICEGDVNLKSFVLQGNDEVNFPSLLNAFSGCSSLIGTPLKQGVEVTYISNVYRNCTNITGEAQLGEGVTSASFAYANSGINSFSFNYEKRALNMAHMFENCRFNSLYLNFFSTDLNDFNNLDWNNMLTGAECIDRGVLIARKESSLGRYFDNCPESMTSAEGFNLSDIPGFLGHEDDYSAYQYRKIDLSLNTDSNIAADFPRNMDVYVINQILS